MHSGVIDPQTGRATKVPGPGWTSTFSEALIKYASKRRDIVAITAAMPGLTGLTAFGKRFPGPVVRRRHRRAARDDVGRRPGNGQPASGGGDLLDVPQPRVRPDHDGRRTASSPVTLVLDRSGVTGPDGASHNGMWDLSMLNIVPGMRVAAPRDAARLYEELGEALDHRRADRPALPQRRCRRGHSGNRTARRHRCARRAGRRPVRRCAAGRGRAVRVDGEIGRRAAA